MNNALQALITQVFGALGTVSPFAKAVSAAGTALAGSLVNMAFAGSFDTTSIVVLGVGVASATVAYLVPNKPAPTAAPAKI